MSDDIETLLRHADAPAMGVSTQEIIAGAQRTRRRRRARYGAYGLAAAVVIGVGVGADRVVADRGRLTPATQSTTGPLGALFKNAKVGEDRFGEYRVSGTAADPRVYIGGASAALRRTQHLGSGVSAFQDGSHTVVVTPLPRAADRASVIFASDSTGGIGSTGMRVNAAATVQISVTEQPGTVRAVIWSEGADYFSTTGERAQVASFAGTRVYWYERLGIYGLDQPDGSSSARGSFLSGYLSEAEGPTGHMTSRFAATVPHGARDVSVRTAKGDTANEPVVRRLGDTAYDVVYVSAPPQKVTSKSSFVQSISWTDGSGRHTKSYS